MIELTEARELVRQSIRVNGPESKTLEAALGCVLAEDVLAPDDSPSYDKAMVDGFAVIATDVSSGSRRLRVIEDVFAGQWPQRTLQLGQATRIMTGAPLPPQADAVVMFEQTQCDDADEPTVEICADQVVAGQNIMRRGTAIQAGQRVLAAGQRLRPVDVGLLAEAGRAEVRVIGQPRVATIQTGDELVDATQSLKPGQIRNSNGPLLSAMIQQAGGIVENLGIIRDDEQQLDQAVQQGLEADVLVVSGGVSAGDRDLVPSVLVRAGVEQVFHKVSLRPGKPLWFGVRRHSTRPTLVFGLPGNPVSGLVSFRLFVTPAIQAIAGHKPNWTWQRRRAKLSESFQVHGPRPTFWPGRFDADRRQVSPLPWKGSADPFTFAASDCLIVFAHGDRTYAAGKVVGTIDLQW